MKDSARTPNNYQRAGPYAEWLAERGQTVCLVRRQSNMRTILTDFFLRVRILLVLVLINTHKSYTQMIKLLVDWAGWLGRLLA